MKRLHQNLLTNELVNFIEIEPIKWTPDGLSIFKYERVRIERLNMKEMKRIFSGMKKTTLYLIGTDIYALQIGRGPLLLIKDGRIGIRKEDSNNCKIKTTNKKAYEVLNKLAMEGLLVNPRRKRVFFKRKGYRPRRKAVWGNRLLSRVE